MRFEDLRLSSEINFSVAQKQQMFPPASLINTKKLTCITLLGLFTKKYSILLKMLFDDLDIKF